MAYDALQSRSNRVFQGTASVIPTDPRDRRKWPIDPERCKVRNLDRRTCRLSERHAPDRDTL
jgi:hypothetical protein